MDGGVRLWQRSSRRVMEARMSERINVGATAWAATGAARAAGREFTASLSRSAARDRLAAAKRAHYELHYRKAAAAIAEAELREWLDL